MAFAILACTGHQTIDIVVSIALAITTVLLSTRIFTEVRYFVQSRGNAGRFEGREPLTLPYTIPWIGGITAVITGHDMYFWAKSKSPQDRPVSLKLGPIKIYVLFGPKNMKTIFKNSKTLTKFSTTMMIFHNSGMSKKDQGVFDEDKSGLAHEPVADVPAQGRIWKKSHDLGPKYLLTAHNVNMLTNMFIQQFNEALDKKPLNHSFTTSLYSYFKDAMFVASTKSLVGTSIFSLCPDLTKDFWEYDGGFTQIAIGLPKFLISAKYAASDRMIDHCKRWINHAWENYDPKNEDADWEECFGSTYSRKMVQVIAESGLSREGQAIAMLPMIWAINSNAIPCTGWIIFEALKRPGLIKTLRDEVAPSMKKDEAGNLTIDIPNLLANSPLLMSMYMECLRTRTSSAVTRKVTEDTECDGYILKKGNHIMAASWQPAHGPIWDVPGHPADTFWPERFIEMPKMKPSDPDEKSAYEKAMRPDEWFPYGGGNVICSGRFFAKQEILAAVAIFVTKYDIEFQGWLDTKGKLTDKAPIPDETMAGVGVLPPCGDARVKITRVS